MNVRLLPGCGKGENSEITLHWVLPVDGFQDLKKNPQKKTETGVENI